MYDKGDISRKVADFVVVKKPRCPIIYLLQKVHKMMMPQLG